MGEGYAAIQRGGGLPVLWGGGSLMASEPYRYTWYLNQLMASLPYIRIYFFQNTYYIEIKMFLSLSEIFLDSQQFFRKVRKKLDFSLK